jgi:hypothetical protein
MKEKDNTQIELGSNSSVLNLSLDISSHNQNNNDIISDSCSNSSFEIPKSLSKKVILKEEKEDTDSTTSNYECIQIKDENNITRKRSKTNYIPRCLINNAPKIKPKIIDDELISPLKLCIKTSYQENSSEKKTNNILYDIQKDLIDCKSCNDTISDDDNDLFFDDIERTTPNETDLNNFSLCRKKMKNVISSSNISSSYEYENILNSESIFQSTCKSSNNFFNCPKNRKNNFWHKHILKQKLKTMEKYKKKYFNKNKQIGFIKSKTFNLDEHKIIDTQGLFILGVLECAANDKKKRITTGKLC